MLEPILILITAVFLDIIIGDPVYPMHPVKLMGAAISTLERLFLHIRFFNGFSGILLVVMVQVLSIGVYWGVCGVLQSYQWIFSLFLTYSLFAFKDLMQHAERVGNHLCKKDLYEARRSIAMIVGRNVATLGYGDIVRAGIESVAENFTDGILSPMFWFVMGAVVGLLTGVSPLLMAVSALVFFKVTSTLDSMVGYRNEKYRYFGRPSARLDDILNFFPARIAIVVISCAAFICGLDGKKAWTIGWRDRLKHVSPNAGHAESSVAGALSVKLGGNTVYSSGIVEKPWLGEGTADIDTHHLKEACQLIHYATLVSLSLSLCVLLSF